MLPEVFPSVSGAPGKSMYAGGSTLKETDDKIGTRSFNELLDQTFYE
jgi:hypothetical protein